MGLAKRILGLGQVAQAQANFSQLIQRGRAVAEVELTQLLAGLPRLLLCFRPGTAGAHDPRTIHPTHTRESRDRLTLAPALGRLGPLSGPGIVGKLRARGNGVAVDDGRGIGAEFTGHSRHGRLIHQGHALCDLPLRDEHAPLVVERDRHQITIAEAGAEIERLPGKGQRGVEISLSLERHDAPGPRHVAAFDTLRLGLDESIGAVQPGGANPRIALLKVPMRDLARRSCRVAGTAGFNIFGIRPLPGRDVGREAACPPGGFRQPLQVLGREQA